MNTNHKNNGQRNGNAFLGEPTAARLSGEVYTAAALALFVVSFVLSAILLGNEGFVGTDGYLYLNFILPQLCFAFALGFVWMRAKPTVGTVVRSQKCQGKYFLIALLLQVGLFGLAELNTLFLQFLGKFGYVDSGIKIPSMEGFGLVGVLFTVALLPAIFEEAVFRGVLLKGLRSLGTVGAVLVSGALFSLYHQNPAQTVYQFCCGAAFALVAIRSGSILPTALAHFINNTTVLLLTKFGVTELGGAAFAVVVAVSAVCLIGSLVWLVFFDKKEDSKKLTAEEKKTDAKDFFLHALIGILVCGASWLTTLFSGLVG